MAVTFRREEKQTAMGELLSLYLMLPDFKLRTREEIARSEADIEAIQNSVKDKEDFLQKYESVGEMMGH